MDLQPDRPAVLRSSAPLLSVVVPVLDGGTDFERCLAALAGSEFRDYELIVVDDGSTDGSPGLAATYGARVVRSAGRRGPGAARNLGVDHARGEVVFFLDADCEVHTDTLGRAAAAFRGSPPPDAIFGSYDDAPAGSGLVARFKNLQHHYVHQRGRSEARTFWAGCGGVRRSVFREVGGFDGELFPRPSIEDIELGYRLRERGFTVRLCPAMQVKHLKQWTLASLIRTDVLDRGVPWTRLMLSRGFLETDLNLVWRHRIAVALAWTLLALVLLSPYAPALLWAAAATAATLLAANLDFYRFLARREGVWFAVRALPLHWLHYLYSGLAFGWGLVAHAWSRMTGRDSDRM
ncbi:MAG: glycosyltransferase family 2 protein [Gemmatimonadota bacterium]